MRILPLHPRQIEGRTDSDTFFSTIKSIRGFSCIQIFYSLQAHYLYIKCLKKESQSHEAFQDFIRYVGAPTTLLTDNSKTQTGKKWTKTCRQYAIAQRNTVPHNQHQNQVERKIGDLK